MKSIVPTRRYAPVSTKAAPAEPRGACAGVSDPDLFFPVGDTGPALLQIIEAKKICATCPVIDACLRGALERGEETGVWGGLSEDERRTLRQRTVRAQLVAVA
ncbi:WhiB family transcriptional regulator [Streptomyces sp. CB02009]|uniref:WhiB family transcriptional regulator n=1 Tax=Streptomyces sp. CB02009 TaxID=1703938 RepID=UPI00093AF9BB|nr:WhiB family transcriptional regulator [Streptomyces sp. CB02009]